MWVQQSGDIISATPLQKADQIKSIYRYLRPERRPDYLNREGKKRFDHQSGLHPVLPLEELVRSSVLRWNHRRTPVRSIITSCSTTSHSNLQGQASSGGPRDPAEPDTPFDAVPQSGGHEDSSSAVLSPLLNLISCYDMAAGDVSCALIRHFLLQPAGLLAVVSTGWG